MTQNEIFEKIKQNDLLIEQLTDVTHFVLNEKVAKLIKENQYLQSICKHEFEDGKCKYCNYVEKKK
jgi:hypothetical protein